MWGDLKETPPIKEAAIMKYSINKWAKFCDLCGWVAIMVLAVLAAGVTIQVIRWVVNMVQGG